MLSELSTKQFLTFFAGASRWLEVLLKERIVLVLELNLKLSFLLAQYLRFTAWFVFLGFRYLIHPLLLILRDFHKAAHLVKPFYELPQSNFGSQREDILDNTTNSALHRFDFRLLNCEGCLQRRFLQLTK